MPETTIEHKTQQGAIEGYLATIGQTLEANEATITTQEELIESQREIRQYQLCCISKADEALAKYQDIAHAISIPAAKEAKNIETITSSDGLTKMHAEIEAKLKELASCFKQVKQKVNAFADTVASKLPAALSDEESCHKDLYDLMVAEVEVAHPVSGDGLKLQEATNYLKTSAEALRDLRQAAAGSTVDTAGIHTFANVESLQDWGAHLCAQVLILKQHVDENIGTATVKVKDTRKVFATTLETLATAKSTIRAEKAIGISLSATQAHVDQLLTGDSDCQPAEQRRETLRKICTYIKESFSSPEDQLEKPAEEPEQPATGA